MSPRYILALSLLSVVSGATVVDKWELPPLPHPSAYSNMYTSYGDPSGSTLTVMERQGSQPGTVTVLERQGSQPATGVISSSSGIISNGVPVFDRQGSASSAYSTGANNYGPPSGVTSYAPYTKDPGFSVQTGFEGYLVPNPWYGLIPWGIEGVVIVVVGIIVFIIIPIGVILAFFKFFKLGKIFKDDDGSGGVEEEVRAYLPSYINRENFNALTSHVYDALDKYNDLIKLRED